jgi:hypothetical protein
MVHPRDDGDLRPELGLVAADAVQLLHGHGSSVGQLAAVHGPVRALVDHESVIEFSQYIDQ